MAENNNNQNRQFVDKKRQVLQNKAIDSGQAKPSNFIALPTGTTAELAALERREGSVAYDTTLDGLVVDDGSAFVAVGGGGGGPTNIELALDTGNGAGSTLTAIRRFANSNKNTLGAYAAYADSATDGMRVTIGASGAGRWSISYSDAGSNSSTRQIGISVNSSSGASSIGGVTYADGKRAISTVTGTSPGQCSVVLNLVNGAVVRAHTNGTTFSDASDSVIFNMTFLGS